MASSEWIPGDDLPGDILWRLSIGYNTPEEKTLDKALESLAVGKEIRVQVGGRIVAIRQDHEEDIPFSCGWECCGLETPAFSWRFEDEG
jgi:hypothetical protein